METLFNAAFDSVDAFLGWFSTVMDICPFHDFIEGLSGLETVLGWVNWLVPVDKMVLILLSWSGVLILYYAISYVMDFVNKTLLK